MKTWQFLLSKLQAGQRTILLYVIDNKGSSPGRKGFKMALAEDGQFTGTIGGGIMEVKLLELAKSKLEKQDHCLLIKQQFHDKNHDKNQSGLICSGEQTVAIISLNSNNEKTIRTIIEQSNKELRIGFSDKGVQILKNDQKEAHFKLIITLNKYKRVHIFGGGHVGAALAQVLSLLNYHILLYDNRPDLDGLKSNPYANEIHIIDYQKLDDFCVFNDEDAVVIVTSSYRSDKLILKQLYQKTFSYIGMMGSDAKLAQLYQELEKEGVLMEQLTSIKMPIGIQIYSKTAMEIAVSIAGEMILEGNKSLPTGRGKTKHIGHIGYNT